jgi:hypothetical protein
MATYDKTTGNAGVPRVGSSSVYRVKNIIDLLTANSGGAFVAADVIKTLNIPANSQVLYYGVRCLRAPAGTALTVTFGASSGTIAGTFAQTATLGSLNPATVTAGLLAADTSLNVTMTTMTTVTDPGKYEFYAVVADLN